MSCGEIARFPAFAVVVFLIGAGFSSPCNAAALSVREIQTSESNQVEIHLDGNLPKNSISVDYVRDNIQISLLNTTIYPAKMLHVDGSVFNKIFAYQYSPNLVRIRFTVNGQAEAFRGKVNWSEVGKVISVKFAAPLAAEPSEQLDEAKEKSLLSKVLGSSEVAKPESKPQNKREENSNSENKGTEKIDLGKGDDARLLNKSPPKLGGARPAPSAGKAFLILVSIVGGLGIVLLLVKRKKPNLQAKMVGTGWWSNFMPGALRKPRSFIEILGQHSLGAKQSIVVVRIKGQQFVLGVSQDNVQLITQLDADESEMDLLDDPAVSESIGKMFGTKPTVTPVAKTSAASFQSMVTRSQAQPVVMPAPTIVVSRPQPTVRQQIRQRLQSADLGGNRGA